MILQILKSQVHCIETQLLIAIALALDNPNTLRAVLSADAFTLTDKAGQVSNPTGIAPLVVVPTYNTNHTVLAKFSGHQAIHDA
jgi:hypothetical protein